MELEKSESVLGSLYALRGGLSAISVEFDRAQRLDKDYHEKLNEVVDRVGGTDYQGTQGTVEFANYISGSGLESELHHKYNRIQEEKVTDYQEKAYKRGAKSGRKDAKISFLIAAIGLVVTVPSVVGLILLFGGRDLYSTLFDFSSTYLGGLAIIVFPVLVLLALAGVIWIIYWSVYGIKDACASKSDGRAAKREEEKNKNLVRDEKLRVKNERQRVQAYIDKLPQIKDEARKIRDQRNAELLPIVQSCNVYYRALREQFNPVLDERDWQHLDLVIYQLETRRADSVKEALQLVDRELQTERIERTVGEATRAICHTLQVGFSALQETIKISCDRVCERLDTISSQLDTIQIQMAVQSLQLSGISGQLADLTDSVNVNSALQAKANETSARLYSDVRAMCSYS